MLPLIEDLAGDWRRLDERREGLSADIATLVAQDPACERLITVPDIGPIISSDFAAWVNLRKRGTVLGTVKTWPPRRWS
jgi:transposase